MSDFQVGGFQQLTQPGLDRVKGDSAQSGLAGKAANGETLVAKASVPSPLAQAADIAEEITQVRSQFKDDLKERKVSKGDDLSRKILDRVKKIQTIQNAQEIKDFLQKLKADPNLTRQQLQEKLKDFSDDVLHQFMALELAAEFFEDLGDTEKAELLRGVTGEFFNNNQTAIKAGINVSEAASEISEETGFSDIRGLREGYSDYLEHASHYLDNVQDHKSWHAAYNAMVDVHGPENFEKAVNIQLKLLATDLGCLDPSTPPERLRAIINDLSELKQMVGLHDGCIETEEQIERMFPEVKLEEQLLMKKMLDLLQQQWVTEADFDKLPDHLNVSEIEAQIFTLTKIVGLVRMLPEEIFPTIEAKMNMQEAASGSLDGVIEVEAGEEIEGSDSDSGYGILGDISASLVPEQVSGEADDRLVPNLGARSPIRAKNR